MRGKPSHFYRLVIQVKLHPYIPTTEALIFLIQLLAGQLDQLCSHNTHVYSQLQRGIEDIAHKLYIFYILNVQWLTRIKTHHEHRTHLKIQSKMGNKEVCLWFFTSVIIVKCAHAHTQTQTLPSHYNKPIIISGSRQ